MSAFLIALMTVAAFFAICTAAVFVWVFLSVGTGAFHED